MEREVICTPSQWEPGERRGCGNCLYLFKRITGAFENKIPEPCKACETIIFTNSGTKVIKTVDREAYKPTD